MTASDLSSDKRKLRRAMRERLSEVDAPARRRAGSSIAECLVRSPVWSSTSCLVAFVSKVDEVDSGPLIDHALAVGRPLALPRMTDSGSLEFVAITDLRELQSGRFGVREPAAGLPAIALSEHALVLVPGLAFDLQGGRLGRGRGYYDRALVDLRRKEQRPLLVGVGYAFQIVEQVPMTVLDARLDGVISEMGICACEASRGRWAGYGRETGERTR